MKRHFLFLFLFTTQIEVTSEAGDLFSKIPSETGNHCLDQAAGHLRYLFGEKAEIKEIFVDQTSENSPIWMKTNLCDGYLVATFHRNSSCTSAHYGFVPIYIRRVWAFGGCKALLPEDSYPRKETVLKN